MVFYCRYMGLIHNKFLLKIPLLLLLCCNFIMAQQDLEEKNIERDTIDPVPQKKPMFIAKKKKKRDTILKKDYVVINYDRDTVMIDTTLTIQKEYRHNFKRKDLFGYLPFLNVGQVVNKMTLFDKSRSLVPQMGFRARHFDYYEIPDIKYYRAPTPFSEIFYKTGFEQGQVLETIFTANTAPNLNFSLTYKGIRSLGLYRFSLVTQGNFRGTVSYRSKNKRYDARFHIAVQDLGSQENGGLKAESIQRFKDHDKDFHSRGRLDTNLGQNTESLLEGTRFYLEQRYYVSNLSKFKGLFRHLFSYEGKNYRFTEQGTTGFFGTTFTEKTFDITAYKSFRNALSVDFKSPYILGDFSVKAYHQSLYQGYRNVNYSDRKQLPYRKEQQYYGLDIDWYIRWKKFNIHAYIGQLLVGGAGSKIGGTFHYPLHKHWRIAGALKITNRQPDMMAQFFQSNYRDYNWDNEGLKNERQQSLSLGIHSKWVQLDVMAKQLENHTYFEKSMPKVKEEEAKVFYRVRAKQAPKTITYLKAQLQSELNFWKFSWNNRVVYQNVQDGAGILNLPKYFFRTSFYFSETLFKKKSLFLQTGATLSYFGNYHADDYNPVIGSFVTQNQTEIEGYPYLELFVNTMIRQTRFFIKFDNFSSIWGKKNYFAAPAYPRQDFEIRFGCVWNLFR